MKKIYLILILLVLFISIEAQEVDQFNSWWYFNGKGRVSDAFSIQTLYSCSRHDFIKQWQQSKLRLGGIYHRTRNVKFVLGYEWIILFPYGAFPVPENRTEYRITE